MRLDKYLKVSRLIKRRTVANEACDNGLVTVNGKPARASYEVKVGDQISLRFGVRTVTVEVLSVQETIRQALRTGPYGRCVYHCDNDVVDHQQTNLLMEDGTTISFTMCAFTEDCYRYFKAMGTKGEIEADMKSNLIHIREFGKPEEVIDVGTLASDLKGHGGGDSGIVGDFLDLLLSGAQPNERTTTLEHSIESHLMALAAEESRLQGGKSIDLDQLRSQVE